MASEAQANVATATPKKRSKTIDEKIADLDAQLKVLQRKKDEMAKKEREKNGKVIAALFQSEGLLDVSADVWKANMLQIKKVLGVDA